MSIHTWHVKITAGLVIFTMAVILVAPAQAFYIEVPQSVKDSFAKLTTQADQNGLVLGIEQTAPEQSMTQDQMRPLMPQQNPMNFNQPNPSGQPGQYQVINIDQGIRNQPMDGQSQNQMNNNQGQMGPNPQEQARQLQNMKRNLQPMENNLKQFERMTKNGQTLSPEMQQKLTDVKNKVETIKNTNSTEELQNFDMGQLNADVAELDQTRRETEDSQRRIQDMQRNIKGAEQGLNMFEKQINTLAKKKITIPTELKDNLQKIKTIIAAVKKAKTWEEMEASGIEDLQDLMMGLDESRQQLEMLSRWPQTLKQIDQQIKNLDNQYKKGQSLVTKLSKKGIDLSVQLTAFKEGIDKLKTVRTEALAKVTSGTTEDIQTAFDLLENDFFGQMDYVMQYQNIIQTMSNLGQFQSEFKRSITQAQTQIKTLSRKKIDTSELSSILNDTKNKGNEILAMIKAPTSELDEDTVMSSLQEIQDLRQQFGDLVAELTGVESGPMPWEQGTPQIQSPTQSFSGFMNLMPKQTSPQETNQEAPVM